MSKLWVEETRHKANTFKRVHTDLYKAHLPIKELAELVQTYKTYEWHIWDNELFSMNQPIGLGFDLDELKDSDIQLRRWFAFINRDRHRVGFTFAGFSTLDPACNRSLCYRRFCICEEPLSEFRKAV